MPEEQELWTPPTPMNANVARMAWLLFMEAWKVAMSSSLRDDEFLFTKVGTAREDESPSIRWAKNAYPRCVVIAEAIEKIQNPTEQGNPLQ